ASAATAMAPASSPPPPPASPPSAASPPATSTASRSRTCPPPPTPSSRANYIVRAPWGDILQVWRSFELDDGEEPRTYELAVFKLDLATEDLVQIKDLRGHALFVSFGTSFFVSVNEFPVLTPYCVYLAHDSIKCRRFKHIAKEVRVYNLQDDTFADQYTQSSWKNCPPPALWFQPTWSLNK
uniref:KIB1-4 beta-propeller domain-containing protein n=1 Tax=Oryza glaberrima TaxID=4538 RepID=I1NMR4_ORYGL